MNEIDCHEHVMREAKMPNLESVDGGNVDWTSKVDVAILEQGQTGHNRASRQLENKTHPEIMIG